MAKIEFVPQSRLVMVLGASGIGQCAELVMPKDGEIVITAATEHAHAVTYRKQVKAGTSVAITDGPQCGRIYSWNVRYIAENDYGA